LTIYIVEYFSMCFLFVLVKGWWQIQQRRSDSAWWRTINTRWCCFYVRMRLFEATWSHGNGGS